MQRKPKEQIPRNVNKPVSNKNDGKEKNVQGNSQKKIKDVTVAQKTKTDVKMSQQSSKMGANIRYSSKTSSNNSTQLVSDSINESLNNTPAKYPINSRAKISDSVIKEQSKLKQANSNTVRTKRIHQPLKAIYVPKESQKISEKNVMNSVHNVTVASPPQHRKTFPLTVSQPPERPLDRERTLTRTLQPDEVLILKDSQKDNLENSSINLIAQPSSSSSSSLSNNDHPASVSIVKESVAFEVKFTVPEKKMHKSFKIEKQANITLDSNENADDYEDDFDSYESDFESVSTSSSNRSSTSSSAAESAEQLVMLNETVDITTLTAAIKSFDERQYDSGHYDLKTNSPESRLSVENTDEKDPSCDGQIDSGIGYDTNYSSKSYLIELPTHTMASQTVDKREKMSKNYKRGYELMEKIQFDTMTFIIFDVKPLSYDCYMKIYGHSNTTQCSTQTKDKSIDEEIQTDNIITRTVWTQWPPTLTVRHILSDEHYENRIGYSCIQSLPLSLEVNINSILENSLDRLKIIKNTTERSLNIPLKSIDHDRLSLFLQKAAMTIAGILVSNNPKISAKKSTVPGCKEYFTLEFIKYPQLSQRKIKGIYGSEEGLSDFLYVVHEAIDNENINYISVWNLSEPLMGPIYILCSWTSVSCVLVSELQIKDLVIAGLTDGSISCWDLGESLQWHSTNMGDDMKKIYVPSHIVSVAGAIKDVGRIVTIKNITTEFLSSNLSIRNYQLMALHEFGLISLWTIIFHSNECDDFNSVCHSLSIENSSSIIIDHQSPWSRIKLIQIRSIDLPELLLQYNVNACPKSAFDRTKSYFESDLFSDTALKELQSRHSMSIVNHNTMDFIATDLVIVDGEQFIVSTNQKYILLGKQCLQENCVRKIVLHDDAFIHSTVLKSVPKKSIILIGHSNGSLTLLQAIDNKLNLNTVNPVDISGNIIEPHLLNVFNEMPHNAKSCAIENMIKNERESSKDAIELSMLTFSNRLFSNNNNLTNHNCLWSTMVNNQILLHGLSFVDHGITSIFISKQSNCIYVICGTKLRVMDVATSTEQNTDTDNNILDGTLIKGTGGKREFLCLVKEDNNIDIHMI